MIITEFLRAFRHSRDKILFDRLKKILQDQKLVDQLTNIPDYNSIQPLVKDLDSKQCFVLLLDNTPLLYIIPNSSPRMKDYTIFYRVGYVDPYTFSLISLDLNISSDYGRICPMPDSTDMSKPLGLYYCFDCNERDIKTKNRILKYFLPVQREVSYKLNILISRIMGELGNQAALSKEFYVEDDEEEYDEEEYN